MLLGGGVKFPGGKRYEGVRFNIISVTRVASHLARSDTPSITCIVARISRSDTQQCYDANPTKGKAPREPLASAAQCLHAKFHYKFTKLAVT